MKIISIALAELKPYKNNPRINDTAVDAVAASIREFGFKVPLVIDEDNGIICGHTRYKAAKKLGLDNIPAIVANDLTSTQIKAFRLADNKVSELSSWDDELLKLELDSLSDVLDLNMGDFGFDMPDKNSKHEDVTEDDYEPRPPEKPKSKLGDVYQLGDHYLMCGDSTKLSNVEVLTKMGAGQMDLLLTDPPYNVAYQGKSGEKLTIKNDNMEDDAFFRFLSAAFGTADKVMKPGASYYIWHADSEGYNFRSAVRATGWKVRQCLIWVKNALVLGRQDYQWKHEPCLYGWKEGAAHHWYGGRRERTTVTSYDIMELRNKTKSELLQWVDEYLANGDDVDTSLLYEKKPAANLEHPTMKPVKLLARQINNSTIKGECVLDIFGGSGSTLIACEQLGRRCFMMEYDPRFVDVIINRWEKFTSKSVKKLE